MIKRIFPFIGWKEGYNTKRFREDFIAGLTVALVLIPQSMAYAQLAGLPAYYGLYAAFLPPMIASLFGSSHQLATGPVAIVSLMTAASLEPIATAGSESFIAYAIMLAVMVGLFQFLLGVLRLGIIVNLLSHPVVIGFTNAAAIIIATSQLSKIFGVYVDKAEHHYETIYRVVAAAFHYTHLPTLGLAILAFAIMILLKRINPKIPNVLIAAVVTILIAWIFGFEAKYKTELAAVKSQEVLNTIQQYNQTVEEINAVSNIGFNFSKKEVLNKIELSDTASTFALHNTCYKCHSVKEFTSLGIAITKNESIPSKEIIKLIHDVNLHDRHLLSLKEKLPKFRARLRDYHLEGVANGDGLLEFYLPAEIPGSKEGDGKVWRIKIKNGALDPSAVILASGGDVVGKIPEGLPKLSMPVLDFSIMSQLIAAMIIISLLGFMEAISIAKAMATKTGQRLDPNQELIGQGLANMIGAAGQSYPVSGSFSRSAVNLSSGGVTGLSNVMSSLFVAATLLFFTPALYFLPQAVLAAIIMMAVVGLINIKSFIHAYQTQKYEGIISVITFISTLVFAPHLDRGILIGLLLTILLFIIRRIQPGVAILSKHWDSTFRSAERFNLAECHYLSLVRFRGSLTFASCSHLEDKVLEQIAIKSKLKYVLIIGNGINEIDASGEGMLETLVSRLREAHYDIFFSGLNDTILDVFKQTGLDKKIGDDHFYRNAGMAVDALHKQSHINSTEDKCPLLEPVKVTD